MYPSLPVRVHRVVRVVAQQRRYRASKNDTFRVTPGREKVKTKKEEKKGRGRQTHSDAPFLGPQDRSAQPSPAPIRLYVRCDETTWQKSHHHHQHNSRVVSRCGRCGGCYPGWATREGEREGEKGQRAYNTRTPIRRAHQLHQLQRFACEVYGETIGNVAMENKIKQKGTHEPSRESSHGPSLTCPATCPPVCHCILR
ncbi:hypothetical protein LZ32DRAFT_73872 [Colletotrichum eremochloae]|nr:hypothetical protein LZ32DRAFT_73872 [Colletotrichum eremochloae]